jgi:hypothetical protein
VYVRSLRTGRQVSFAVPRGHGFDVTSKLTRTNVFIGRVVVEDIEGFPRRWRIYSYRLPRWLRRLETRAP